MATSSITHAAKPIKRFEPNTLVQFNDQKPLVILVTKMFEDQLFEGVVMHDSSYQDAYPIGKIVTHSPKNFYLFTGKLTLSNA